MRLLIDTHIFTWAVSGSPRLPSAAKALIERDDNQVFVSAVTIWEIAIKHSLPTRRADPMPISGREALAWIGQSDYHLLSITPTHAAEIDILRQAHGDPFDRMLIIQALTEPLTLVTSDSKLAAYNDAIVLV